MPGRGGRAPAAALVVALLVVALVMGCSTSGGPASAPPPEPPPPSARATPIAPSTPTPGGAAAADPALREELLAMLAADQADRAQEQEQPDIAAERARTQRLGEILDQHGWPTRTLVGPDGATAAWVIAQHSDLDPRFQERALELMRGAAAVGEADPGELAYLVDRVAANAGRPQTYGTQMGCSPEGRPQIAELAEPDRVDALRAEAGLAPLADYLAELAEVCATS